EAVGKGEGVAVHDAAEAELALEIGGPDLVRCLRTQRWGGWLSRMDATSSRRHEMVTPEQVAHRTGCRENIGQFGVLQRQVRKDLPRPPVVALTTGLKEQRLDRGLHPLRRGKRRSRTISKALQTFGSVACKPLIAVLPADAVLPAEFGHRVEAALMGQNETHPFVQGVTHFPRHRSPRGERKSCSVAECHRCRRSILSPL